MKTMKRYEASDESSGSEIIEAENLDDAKDQTEDSWKDGDWGDEGALIRVDLREIDHHGDYTGDEITIEVEIEPEGECYNENDELSRLWYWELMART